MSLTEMPVSFAARALEGQRQATANAMYERQRNALLALFDGSSRPSLVLDHGKSRMHAGFRQTVLKQPGSDRFSPDANAPDVPGEIACAAFLANSQSCGVHGWRFTRTTRT
jgi:hypothetical protein